MLDPTSTGFIIDYEITKKKIIDYEIQPVVIE